MKQTGFDDDHNDPEAQRLVRAIERFMRIYRHRTGRHGQKVLADDYQRLDGRKIEQEPERFIEDILIKPVLESLGHEIRFRPKGFAGLEGRIPDFTLLNMEASNFGEVKTPGSITNAREEAVEYLEMATDRPLFGIATDGFTWVLYTAERGSGPLYTRHVPISKIIRRINQEQSSTQATRKDRTKLRELALDFVNAFGPEAIEKQLE